MWGMTELSPLGSLGGLKEQQGAAAAAAAGGAACSSGCSSCGSNCNSSTCSSGCCSKTTSSSGCCSSGSSSSQAAREAAVDLKVAQGRAHIFSDMRLVDDAGRELPRDGKAVGHLQVGAGGGRQGARQPVLCPDSGVQSSVDWLPHAAPTSAS
jgi:hypothetical protein